MRVDPMGAIPETMKEGTDRRPAPAAHFVAGGPIGAIHKQLLADLNDHDGIADGRRASTMVETIVSQASRAMGPVLLVAGYSAAARYFFT